VKWLIALAALCVAAFPARATSPALPTFSRYGPVLLCGHSFSIAVGPDEATGHASGFPFLLTESHTLHIGEGAAATLPPYLRARPVNVPGLGTMRLYSVGGGPGGAGRTWLYIAAVPNGASQEVTISSAQFTGTPLDHAMLARVRIGADPGGCPGPHWTDPAFGAVEDGPVATWSPARIAGPFFLCGQGIGLRVRAGETVQLPWRHLDLDFPLFHGDGLDVGISGPRWGVQGRGRVLASPGAVDVRFGRAPSPPRRLMATLDAAPGHRRDGYWNATLWFPPETSEEAARPFLGRLEFVRRGDRRCTAGLPSRP
jgi:hypothetical protein